MRKYVLHKMELGDAISDLHKLVDMFTNSNGKRLPISLNFSNDTDYVQVEIDDTGVNIVDYFPETDFEALDELIHNAHKLSDKCTSIPALLDTGLYAVFGVTVRKVINHVKTVNDGIALEFGEGCNFSSDLPNGSLFSIDNDLNLEELDLVVEPQQDKFVIKRISDGAYLPFTNDLSILRYKD